MEKMNDYENMVNLQNSDGPKNKVQLIGIPIISTRDVLRR